VSAVRWGKARRKQIEWALVAVLFLVTAVFWNIVAAIVITLFLVALVLDIDSGIPFAIALVLLVAAALLVAIQEDSAAKVSAQWSFLFLSVGVLVQLRGYIASGEPAEEKKPASPSGSEWQEKDD
jgi:Na+/H+ antiporter NhaD/arsenite permease-like protein